LTTTNTNVSALVDNHNATSLKVQTIRFTHFVYYVFSSH